MPETAYAVFTAVLLVCCALCLYRIGRGPTAPDRTVGIDILGTVVVGFCGATRGGCGQRLFDERSAGVGAGEFYWHVGLGQAPGMANKRCVTKSVW